jgi:hypothetical protein
VHGCRDEYFTEEQALRYLAAAAEYRLQCGELFDKVRSLFDTPGTGCEPGPVMGRADDAELAILLLRIEKVFPFFRHVRSGHSFLIISRKNHLIGDRYGTAVVLGSALIDAQSLIVER